MRTPALARKGPAGKAWPPRTLRLQDIPSGDPAKHLDSVTLEFPLGPYPWRETHGSASGTRDRGTLVRVLRPHERRPAQAISDPGHPRAGDMPPDRVQIRGTL